MLLTLTNLKFCHTNTDTQFFLIFFKKRNMPREREVVGLIPGCDRPKSLNLVVVAFPFGGQDYGNSTTPFYLTHPHTMTPFDASGKHF